MFQAQRFQLSDESPYVHTNKNRTPLQLQGKRRVLVAGARKQLQERTQFHPCRVMKMTEGRRVLATRRKLYVLFFSCGGTLPFHLGTIGMDAGGPAPMRRKRWIASLRKKFRIQVREPMKRPESKKEAAINERNWLGSSPS